MKKERINEYREKQTEQTEERLQWINGISPWDRMLLFVRSYNVFPEEMRRKRNDKSDK